MLEIKISKKDTEKMLADYYRAQEDFNGTVQIKCSTEWVGNGAMEREEVVKTVLTGTLSVLDSKVKMSRNIPEEEVKEVFATLLEKEGYDVKDTSFDTETKETYQGSGMNEHAVKKIWCNGLVLTVQRNNKTMTKQLNSN